MKRTTYIIIIALVAGIFAGCSPLSRQISKHRKVKSVFQLKARDYYLQGLYAEQSARYNEALVHFYQALHHDSTSPTIYNSIAENHLRLEHYESAEILLKQSLALDPANWDALNLMAQVQLRLGRDDQAIKYFKKLTEIDPYDDDARQYLILLYEKNGNSKGVADQDEALLKLYGRNPALLDRLAGIYFNNKEYEKAKRYYLEILKDDSTNARVLYLTGRIYEIKQHTDSAATLYRKALRYKPNFAEALDRLTFIYRMRSQWQKIIDLYTPVLEADSTNRAARVLSAEAYYYLKDFDRARGLLQPIMRQKKPPVSVMELMGRIELESKNAPQAIEIFRKILTEDAKNKFAWMFLGFAYSDNKQDVEAQKTYEQALKIFPDDASLWSFYGVNLQQQKKYKESVAAFEKTLKLDPENINALSGLPVVYETLKMYDRCDSLYEVAITRYPDNALLLNNYSYSLAERNKNLEKALKMVQKALKIRPKEAAYLDTIGWIYYKLGKYSSAEKYIKESIDLRINSAVVLEHLGDVYLKMGKINKALEYWQKSLQNKPDNAKLEKKIQELQH